MLAVAISTHRIMAQNVTTNALNAAGNMSPAANQTASELGQNTTSVLSNAGDKVGSALGELKQNMSEVGTEILNKTEEAAKKIGTGVADVLYNISGEIKEGINGK